MTRLTAIAGALLIALLLSSSYLLDEPTENDAAQATALDLQDAQLAAVAARKESK